MRHPFFSHASFANKTLALFVALGISACSAKNDEPEARRVDAPAPDKGTVADVDDNPFADAEATLTPLATPCSFNATSGVMTVTVADNETAILSLRLADKAILQNGQTCAVVATSTTLKKISVVGSAGANNLVLDFTNGLFALGTSSPASGVAVALAGGGDTIGIKGTSGNDTVTFGVSGILMNNDTNKDITITGAITKYTVSLGDGDDTFTASGNATAGAAFTAGVTIYGGAGNDTFNEGALPTPSEVISGGTGTDTVSYTLRPTGHAVNVTLGAGSTDDGESLELDDVKDADVVTGGAGNDTLTAASGVAVTFNGGAGNDTLTGDSGADTLNGEAGDDILAGAAGADTENGGDGDDTFDEGATANAGDIFNGGLGSDTVDYSGRSAALTVTMDGIAANDGASNEADNVKGDVENLKGSSVGDDITGNALNNTIWGNDGNDVVHGGAGDDTFATASTSTDDGDDTYWGEGGVDTVSYAGRTNAITAALIDTGTPTGSGENGEADLIQADVENLTGGDGGDTLVGNSAANELVGGPGADTLTGNAGDDTIEGGAVGNSEANVIDCGTGDGDLVLNPGSGTPTACEFP